MSLRLISAEIRHRPGRMGFLLGGYALGVAVMVVLLSVGEAMLAQARDRALLGGGDLVMVPAGISPEMLKAGGATTLFLGIDQARFLQRQVLESARGREEYGIAAASPVLDGRLVVLEARGRSVQALASGEIPSRAAAAGARPRLLAGSWEDTDADRRWASPTAQELYTEIDRLHLPPAEARGDSTWAEWHYFNVVLEPERWLYVTLLIGGRVGVPGQWGGRVLLTLRERDGSHRSFTRDYADHEVRFDTLSPDLEFAGGAASVALREGAYRVVAGAGPASLDLRVEPVPGLHFPPAQLGGSGLISGYVVPALRASASGTVCLPECTAVRGAISYHDHNWGVWRDVSWEWGAASSPEISLLYGVVRGAEGAAEERLFAYLVDRRGARGLYRPGAVEVLDTREMVVERTRLTVPRRFRFADPRRGLRVTVEVAAVHATRMERERYPWFLQMRGVATVEERGAPPERLEGFFETYLEEPGAALSERAAPAR